MAARSWSLYGSSEPFQSQGVFGEGDCRVVAHRLSGGLSGGVDVLDVTCGGTQLQIVPTRGMGIRQMVVDGVRIGWQSPVAGPVHPAFVNIGEPSGLGWLDGFDELLVRCGLESNGAPEFADNGQLRYGLHGRIANRPASDVTIAIDEVAGTVVISGVVSETRYLISNLQLTTTITLERSKLGFGVGDRITNLLATPATAQLLYHINIGLPLLGAGTELIAAPRTVVPRTPAAAAGIASWPSMPGPAPGAAEQVFFMDSYDNDGTASVLLADAARDRGLELSYDNRSLPCFSFWKNPIAESDGYVAGIEPATNYPNPKTFEQQQGRVIPLAGGESWECWLAIEFLATRARVAAAAESIERLRGQTPEPTIYDTPQPGWCDGVS